MQSSTAYSVGSFVHVVSGLRTCFAAKLWLVIMSGGSTGEREREIRYGQGHADGAFQ